MASEGIGMLLHIGGNMAVNSRNIVAVLDLSTAGGNRDLRSLLKKAMDQGALERLDENARSLVLLCQRDGTIRVVLSPISSTTLLNRSQAQTGT
jgi:hypothetical protein